MMGDDWGDVGFEVLLTRARAGDDSAAWELVERYGPHVLRTVRRTISNRIRARYDSDDFAQAVWASFFAATDRLHQVSEPAQLIGLLTTMTRNKVVDEGRRLLKTQKRDVHRETSMFDAPRRIDIASRDPRPSQFAVARERWQRLIDSQPEQHREVMRLKLQGRSNGSIATTLGVSRRTVERIMERISRKVEDEYESEES